MSDDDSELLQMQELWNDAKTELNRLRKLKKTQEKQLNDKELKIKELTKLFEERKRGIEQAILEFKGKENAYKTELQVLNEKLEEEVKIRREMEELKYDLEFKLENETQASNNYKISHEKLQISYEHV